MASKQARKEGACMPAMADVGKSGIEKVGKAGIGRRAKRGRRGGQWAAVFVSS